MKIKFIGKSDYNFTKNHTYQLVKIDIGDFIVSAYISDNENKIRYVPYMSLELFNDNWEVVNE